jgi:hypothetical protein
MSDAPFLKRRCSDVQDQTEQQDVAIAGRRRTSVPRQSQFDRVDGTGMGGRIGDRFVQVLGRFNPAVRDRPLCGLSTDAR